MYLETPSGTRRNYRRWKILLFILLEVIESIKKTINYNYSTNKSNLLFVKSKVLNSRSDNI